MKKLFFWFLLFISTTSFGQGLPIQPGAERLDHYLPLLQGKRVGLLANHTSVIGKQHLLDVLLQHNIQVTVIFAPEHGFRGNEDHRVKNSIDAKTGIPIISLHGKKLTPTPEDLNNVDILIFDIQDVGVRFYTYISTLQKFMEAAVNNNKPLVILDRPNPNGFYIDGPVLDLKYKSFTGMQPIPVVYGMTIGEYAKMLVGEQWLNVQPKSKSLELKLHVIPCAHYTHKDLYTLPIMPSPNLPNSQAIYWYPALGLMEATPLSVGRGTDKSFQVFGHPAYKNKKRFTFTPGARPWLPNPPFLGQACYGWDVSGSKKKVLEKINKHLQIKYLIQAYQYFPDKQHFFKGFAGAAGTGILEKQIRAGISENKIRASWEPKLIEFKAIRKKYLIYP